MDERIRVSDADRERVAERLREHFAEGRLTSEELEERITVALTAKTVGDLRRVLSDLPGAASVPGAMPVRPAGQATRTRARRSAPVRWRPHPLPLLLIAVVAAVLLPGAGALLVIVKFVLLLWLLAIVAAIAGIVRLGRRAHRHWHEAQRQWSQAQTSWTQGPWSQAQTSWTQGPWSQDWQLYWRQAHHWHGRHHHHWQGDYTS